jgi:hypothetical protein
MEVVEFQEVCFVCIVTCCGSFYSLWRVVIKKRRSLDFLANYLGSSTKCCSKHVEKLIRNLDEGAAVKTWRVARAGEQRYFKYKFCAKK